VYQPFKGLRKEGKVWGGKNGPPTRGVNLKEKSQRVYSAGERPGPKRKRIKNQVISILNPTLNKRKGKREIH